MGCEGKVDAVRNLLAHIPSLLQGAASHLDIGRLIPTVELLEEVHLKENTGNAIDTV